MNVVIIGLGLMGSSLALNLKKNQDIKCVAGFDENIENQEKALELNCIDRIISFDECKKYDVIILAIPVNAIKNTISKLNDINEKTTIIDLGSTKKDIISAVPKNIRKNYVACHPMTGTEKSGPTAAFEELYHNKKIIFCDIDDSGEYQKNIAIKIFSDMKMNLVFMNADEHDLYMASISHLPHLLSYALTNSILKQESSDDMLDIVGGGFRDMSRLSKSPPSMWIDIFLNNKENILNICEIFEDEIKKAKSYIKNNNKKAIKDWILNANKKKE